MLRILQTVAVYYDLRLFAWYTDHHAACGRTLSLGKGRTAIFRTPDVDVRPATSEGGTSKADGRTSRTEIDSIMLQKAMEEAEAKSKITFWNPTVSAVMRYLQLTTVRYSMSKNASTLLEKAVKRAYPEIYKAVREQQKK